MPINRKTAAWARKELSVYGRPVQANVLDDRKPDHPMIHQCFLVAIRKVRGQDVWYGTERGTGTEWLIIQVAF